MMLLVMQQKLTIVVGGSDRVVPVYWAGEEQLPIIGPYSSQRCQLIHIGLKVNQSINSMRGSGEGQFLENLVFQNHSVSVCSVGRVNFMRKEFADIDRLYLGYAHEGSHQRSGEADERQRWILIGKKELELIDYGAAKGHIAKKRKPYVITATKDDQIYPCLRIVSEPNNITLHGFDIPRWLDQSFVYEINYV